MNKMNRKEGCRFGIMRGGIIEGSNGERLFY